MNLDALSSAELIAALDLEWGAGNRALAKMLAYLGEVERRGLHVEMACSSMFAFLERRFGLTGGSAYRRLTAARLVRRFPCILPRVERGEIHLEALCALREVLTDDNVEEVLAKASKKTLRELEPLVASLAPRPDVKPSIRKLPEWTPHAVCTTTEPTAVPPPQAPSTQPEVPRPRVEQLSEARHKVQLTVSSETRAKIERARHLMAHRNPSGDLEMLFEQAIDASSRSSRRSDSPRRRGRRRIVVRPNRATCPPRCAVPSSNATASDARTSMQRAIVAMPRGSSSSITSFLERIAEATSHRTCASYADQQPEIRRSRVRKSLRGGPNRGAAPADFRIGSGGESD